jgi:hypothetical protein
LHFKITIKIWLHKKGTVKNGAIFDFYPNSDANIRFSVYLIEK